MFWIFLLFVGGANAQTATTQVERGEALFLNAENGCATCHALKGKGTAIGPDLRPVARLSPKGLATAIRSSVTQYVQTAKIKDVGSFPAMTVATPQDDPTVQLYDLSKNPPELVKAPRADVSMTPNNGWKHPPSVRKYTPQELADIVAYVRFAAIGSKQAIDPDEIQ